MDGQELAWLLQCAEKLNPRDEYPVHVRRLLHKLSIPLKKTTGTKRIKTLAELHRVGPGEYRIQLARETSAPHPLTARERFTLAHELGHVLLDYRFNWRPTSEREYHRGERWCNIFAAKLLVPDSALQDLTPRSPAEGVKALRTVTRRCHISREVAARRLVETYPTLVYLEGSESRNKVDKHVFQVAWFAAASDDLGLTRRRKLGHNHPVGRLLLRPPGKSAAQDPRPLPVLVESILVRERPDGRKLVCMTRPAESSGIMQRVM